LRKKKNLFLSRNTYFFRERERERERRGNKKEREKREQEREREEGRGFISKKKKKRNTPQDPLSTLPYQRSFSPKRHHFTLAPP